MKNKQIRYVGDFFIGSGIGISIALLLKAEFGILSFLPGLFIVIGLVIYFFTFTINYIK